MIKPVILWTDALLFILSSLVVVFIFYARTRPHIRGPWQRIFRGRIAAASLVVLLVFVIIGLLDSLHYRLPLENDVKSDEIHYAIEVLSVLDALTGPLRTQEEKSYSAPFATHLYTKETIDRPDGTQVREYPRLQYGGAHLGDRLEDKTGDIVTRIGLSLLQAIIAGAVLTVLLAMLLGRKHRQGTGKMARAIIAGRTDIPWHVILFVLTLLLGLLFLALNLATVYHVLGTDKVGKDVLYLSLKSIRTGLLIGTLTTLVMLPFAIFLGIVAGYARGWIDDVVQYFYTTLNSIPSVLLIAAAILMLQVYIANHPELFETTQERSDIRLLWLCIILGITSWTGLCRLLRGESLKLRESEYIQAAVSFGVSHGRIITRHILPNVMHIVLITVVLDFSGLVLAEAVLSYVGVGVDPTMNSWGNMINGARLEMAREPVVWWSLLSAFLFMFTLVLAANLFSDAVRDAFDPRSAARQRD
ncbi:MAG: ABC transporter permease [Thiohalobacterales bacterium]|nr:ABC transporter permease [Thiohalobacterales bacterium]